MPKARNHLDNLLRDEAKNMLGRTPAQGWLKPERVALLTTKRLTLQDAIDKDRGQLYVDRAELEFVLESPRSKSQTNPVRPSPDLLERFLRLEAASAQQIQEFASRFGALLIFCKIENRKTLPGKLVIFEDCAVWRYFAGSMRSLLRIASCFHAERRSDPVDWDRLGAFPMSSVSAKERPYDPLSATSIGGEEAWTTMAHFVRHGADRDRTMWARFLNSLLELGRVRPWLVWEGAGGSARPKLLFSGPNLLSYLSLQLCLRASKHDAFAVCSYCNQQYTPTGRTPKAGQRNFCPDCREAGVPVRIAQRARRDRLRGENPAAT
jgi:hypothetical protein